MIGRVAAALAAIVLLAAAAPSGPVAKDLDSQVVLQRYALAIAGITQPKAMIFGYTVSQAGPNNIEQRHVVYRSGDAVRDEMLASEGVALRRKIVRIEHREDPYAIVKTAPRTADYQVLFLGTVQDGRHDDYVYETTPLIRTSAAWIDRLTIDGASFLPRVLHFHTARGAVQGIGQIEYGRVSKYWVPLLATAEAHVNGKPARERITWGDYRFPESLPASAFSAPKPLPHMTLPPI